MHGASSSTSVSFTSDEPVAKCDICQENPVYAVCHEDRAFLCRSCDVAIHSANPHAAKHTRFLMTNARVALHPVSAPAAAAPVAATAFASSKKRKVADVEAASEFAALADAAVPIFQGSLSTESQSINAELGTFVDELLDNGGKGAKAKDYVASDAFLDFDFVGFESDSVVPIM